MYLKSIEMHGFKSFANKIVLDFHNGITGIVGPNGSGKSNVADAVRWVLGEQSAKQLRGNSMTDVIFAGTENRKPHSFAYVAITLDNSDHVLPVDYEEVTIARRVYRSGESEYLLNGTACRLRDVQELFYDTGIGKEGYSIIGQGQIERIISGKPEERRELFDEAVGIVKFKKRKNAAVRNLEKEHENLTRVSDILSELEKQIGPLEKQAETAKLYLRRKEEIKKLDANLFLRESKENGAALKKIQQDYEITDGQLSEAREESSRIHEEFEELDQKIKGFEEQIEDLRSQESIGQQQKNDLENQIRLLEEQIRSAASSDESLSGRIKEADNRMTSFQQELSDYESEMTEQKKTLSEATERLRRATEEYQSLETGIREDTKAMDEAKAKIMKLHDSRAEILAESKHFETMKEQTCIRRTELNQRLISRKTQESLLAETLSSAKQEYEKAERAAGEIEKKQEQLDTQIADRDEKIHILSDERQKIFSDRAVLSSRLEVVRGIAERYEGFGSSVRSVMSRKEDTPGLCGVVSELIHVKRSYETAVETALGGNISNIVTEDDETARKMISYLKKNHLGRATFLPLTSVRPRGLKNEDPLLESGIVGTASSLVDTEEKYRPAVEFLLGRVLVAKTYEDALHLSKKYRQGLHIVTLEGEYFSPGGSVSGGAYKNKSHLLGRSREIDELTEKIQSASDELVQKEKRLVEEKTARDLLLDDQKAVRGDLADARILLNTAKIHYDRAIEQQKDGQKASDSLKEESEKIEKQLREIDSEIASGKDALTDSKEQEKSLNEEIQRLSADSDEKAYNVNAASRTLSQAQIDEASAKKSVEFVEANIKRVREEIENLRNSKESLLQEANRTRESAQEKKDRIESIRRTITDAQDLLEKLQKDREDLTKKREVTSKKHKECFSRQDEISGKIGGLEKEILRLDNQRSKRQEAVDFSISRLWSEYELTPHAAEDYRDDALLSSDDLKKRVSGLRDDIRRMGSVNVNAIEDYQELSERYDFLRKQHDDIVDAEAKLSEVIDELDSGMRKQFTEGFAEIQREFTCSFRALFGGGSCSLELVDDDDMLECGIRIIAQPPGKKLQSMMMLSGGEKSLTAIALLFAIQNRKPSPFCLLDEIDAALDDSNVDRFANYLHRLTKNTQFIIITHRRGTMNTADRLYGITMQEKGVSALVSVSLIEKELDE